MYSLLLKECSSKKELIRHKKSLMACGEDIMSDRLLKTKEKIGTTD